MRRGLRKIKNRVTLPSNLVFYASFGGSTIPSKDDTNVYNLTPSNATIANDATRGNVLSLTGGYVSTDLTTTSSFTRAFWAYNRASGAISGNYVSSSLAPIWFNNENVLSAAVNFLVTGDTRIKDTTSRGINSWVHYAVTYDNSSRTLSMYVNGTLVSSAVTSVSFSGDTNVVQFGVWNSGTSIHPSCYLDNIRQYNRALTSSEVMTLYTLSL